MASRLSQALSSPPSAPVSSPSQAAPVDPAQSPASSPSQAENPPVEEYTPSQTEEGAPGQVAGEPEGEPNPYADLDDPGDQAAIEAFLKTPRGREVYQGYKFTETLAKPTAQGGIGHVPTVQDVKTYFASHRDSMAMVNDVTSGDPARTERFFAHWLKPGAPALQFLEPTLAKMGGDAYGAIATPVLSRYEGQLVNRWREAQDPGSKAALYQAAQTLHFDMTGEWLPETAFLNGNGGGNGNGYSPRSNGNGNGYSQNGQQSNGLSSEWDRLQAAQAQLRSQQDQIRQSNDTQWTGSLRSAEASALSSEVDRALTPLVKMKIETPEIYESLKDRMRAQVQSAMQSDGEVWQIYQAKVEQARRSGNPEAVKSIVKDYLSSAIPVIREKRASFLKGAGVVVRQNNTDRHAQLRSIASHTAPANNGAPVQRSVVPPSQPKQGESKADYQERRMREAMGLG